MPSRRTTEKPIIALTERMSPQLVEAKERLKKAETQEVWDEGANKEFQRMITDYEKEVNNSPLQSARTERLN